MIIVEDGDNHHLLDLQIAGHALQFIADLLRCTHDTVSYTHLTLPTIYSV